MPFDLSAPATRVVFQTPPHCIEGYSHRDGNVLVAVMIANEDLFAGYTRVDLDDVAMALAMLIRGGFYRDMTTQQVGSELHKLFRTPSDVSFK